MNRRHLKHVLLGSSKTDPTLNLSLNLAPKHGRLRNLPPSQRIWCKSGTAARSTGTSARSQSRRRRLGAWSSWESERGEICPVLWGRKWAWWCALGCPGTKGMLQSSCWLLQNVKLSQAALWMSQREMHRQVHCSKYQLVLFCVQGEYYVSSVV